jgi:hypothetical protein
MFENGINTGVTRREFGKSALTAGIVAAAGSLLLEREAEAAATDIDVLNFALNLEYLEAEFYTVAVTGTRIADLGIGTTGPGTPGQTIGGAKVAFDDRTNTVAMHVAADEQAHVRFLRAALGSAAIAKPAINLEALAIGFRNQNEFITLARAFEDVGVSAYGGAAALIQNKKLLTAAAQIALTEGQHAGVFRLLLRDADIPVPQLDNMDVPPLGSPAGRLFQVDGQGLSTIRTTSQVLAILYANSNSGANAGGFFPSGLNGTITRV